MCKKLDTFDLREIRSIPVEKYFKKTQIEAPVRATDCARTAALPVDPAEFLCLALAPKKQTAEFVRQVHPARQPEPSSLFAPPSLISGAAAPSALASAAASLPPRDDTTQHPAGASQGALSVLPEPRRISFDSIDPAKAPKSLDHQGVEDVVVAVLDELPSRDTGAVEFQELLTALGAEFVRLGNTDVTVQFVFVVLNIMCTKYGFALEPTPSGSLLFRFKRD